MPSLDDILVTLVNNDYHYYVPSALLLDLIKLHAHYMLEGDVVDIKYEKPMESEWLRNVATDRLLSSLELNLDKFPGDNPLEKAISTLKELARTINFRALEGGMEFNHTADNFVVDYTRDDVCLFRETDEVDADTVAKVLWLSAFMESNLPIQDDSERSLKEQRRMTNYIEMFRASKSSLVRPDFKLKLVNKTLKVTGDVAEEHNEDILVYLEDASMSMTKSNEAAVSKAIQRALCKDPRPVHYYRFVGKKIDLYILDDLAEKLRVFGSDKEHEGVDTDFYSLFDLITSKYKRGDVIMSTDGLGSIPTKLDTNLKFYCVGMNQNVNLNNIVKSTGGSYIIV